MTKPSEPVWLIDNSVFDVWIPIIVVRRDGRVCICYAPEDADSEEVCECALPKDETRETSET